MSSGEHANEHTYRTRRVWAVSLLVSPLVVVLVLSFVASHRRSSEMAENESFLTLARRLPTSDLALSGGARWLRGLSLEEPGAAFADGPAVPDPDPAGGAVAPPVDVWMIEAQRSRSSTAIVTKGSP